MRGRNCLPLIRTFSGGYANHDLATLLVLLKVVVRINDFVERKYPIDDWAESVTSQTTLHVVQACFSADRIVENCNHAVGMKTNLAQTHRDYRHFRGPT